MREVGSGKMGEGCSDSRLPHPGTPEAQSESHDWRMGWRERDSGKGQTMKIDRVNFNTYSTSSDFVNQVSISFSHTETFNVF